MLTVVAVETKMLFRSARRNGAACASASRLSRKLPPGNWRGGDLKISDSVSVEAVAIQ